MASTRGPVPTRKAATTRPKVKPPRLRPGLHPLAVHWYKSLAKSGQSAYYEPSDWAAALVIAEAIDQYASKPTAALLGTIMAGWTTLLATEGDRRRLGAELEQAATGGNMLDELRSRRDAKRGA